MNQFDQAPVNGEAIEESIAIVCNGNTAPKAIAAGQYLFIKNHSTLATGGYHATDAIASGDTLISSNVTSDPDGIANAINGKIPAVVNNLTSDSTTDALSAAQGKALNSKITQIDITSTTFKDFTLAANARTVIYPTSPTVPAGYKAVLVSAVIGINTTVFLIGLNSYNNYVTYWNTTGTAYSGNDFPMYCSWLILPHT